MAMSGGIDSSVAALLLRQQDYEIMGITFSNLEGDESAGEEAGTLAKQLGIEHHKLDVRQCFRQTVIKNFIDEYLSARTPNPCVWCNQIIKWGMLLQKADELNCDFLATGHYAQIIQRDGRFFIKKGKDILKDQSYFLWKLTSEQLSRTLFPLGALTKAEVREIASSNGFVNLSQKKESEEICFVPDNNYRNFLKENVPDLQDKMRPGKFVDIEGKVLGMHTGLCNYTIGQRKGLGIALGVPAYVVALDSRRNRVVIGNKEDLRGSELVAQDVNLTKYNDFADGFSVDCRIRYRSQGVPAKLYHTENGIRVLFDEPVESITPGQSVVFYENDELVGGGIIQ